jgi:hypothetical protein
VESLKALSNPDSRQPRSSPPPLYATGMPPSKAFLQMTPSTRHVRSDRITPSASTLELIQQVNDNLEEKDEAAEIAVVQALTSHPYVSGSVGPYVA